jgi:ribosomal protein S1/(E)-4-hydroxy-3-methyl-but-2-enyl pyrophosphate reductase
MQIELAQYAGFCPGVRRAIETAYRNCHDENSTWMLGEIVHNKHVIQELLNKGLKLARTLEEIPDYARVIIRAHGVAPEIIEKLQAKHCEIIDQTCPFVTKVQKLAAEAAKCGAGLIITGDPDHPEVRGLVGHYGAPPIIINNIAEAEAADFDGGDWMLVSQTTFSAAQFEQISKILNKKIANLRVFDTICVTAEQRQAEAAELAARSDLIFVLGSSTSSNTMKLVEVCASRNSNVRLIEDPEQIEDLLRQNITAQKKIGITAGASTPQGMIREVIQKMKEQEGLVAQEEKETALTHQPEKEQESLVATAEEFIAAEPEAQARTEDLPEATTTVEEEVVEPEETAEPVTEDAEAAELPTEATETVNEALKAEAEAEVAEEAATVEAEEETAESSGEEPTTETEAEATEPAEMDEVAEDAEAEQEDHAEVSFSDFIDSIPQLKRGSIVTGIVVRKDDNYVYVDVKDKSEGRIPLKEFENDPEYDLEAAVKNHAEMEVYVRHIRNTDMVKEITLSKARVDFSKHKAQIEKAFKEKTPVQVKVVNVVKDGVICAYGSVDIYVHRTQLDLHMVDDLEPYRGESFEILVTQFDANRKRPKVAGSRRSLLQRERRRMAEEFWNNIDIDKFYTGTVRNLTDFGAFVDIGGVDGLVHISELSWNRIKHPSEVVNVGDKIEVFVKDFDRAARKISLGYRLPENDPYKDIESKFPVGSIVRGIVVRMFQFGAFVEIAPGVDALCHISQISDYRLNRPNDVLAIGMEIDARVLEVSNESRRISISIREVEPINPSEEVRAEIEAKQQRRREQRESKQPKREKRERRSKRESKEEAMPTSYVDNHTPTSMAELANISAVTDGGAELLDKLMGDKAKTTEEKVKEEVETEEKVKEEVEEDVKEEGKEDDVKEDVKEEDIDDPAAVVEEAEPDAEMAEACCETEMPAEE